LKLGLLENAWWDSPIDPVSGIEFAKQIGFDAYDIFPLSMTPRLRRDMRKALIKSGLECSSICVVAFSLTDLNSDIRKYTTNWVKQQIDLGYDFGARIVLFVLGEYSMEKQELSPEIQWKWAKEGTIEIADYANALGMTMAFEFMAHKYSLLNSVSEMARFIDEVNHPAVRANADVSHMFLMGDMPESLAKLKNKIANVHFSDCNGKIHGDLPPGRGVVPLARYLAELSNIGFDGPVSVELEWCPEPSKIQDWVREAYSSTSSMMEQLNIRRE
jgi:D-psicose/D-tagatose/L-ribulose 3-epimerase